MDTGSHVELAAVVALGSVKPAQSRSKGPLRPECQTVLHPLLGGFQRQIEFAPWGLLWLLKQK